MVSRKEAGLVLLALLALGLLLGACSPAEPEVVERVVTQVVTEKIVETVVVEGTPQVVEKEVTKVVEVEKEVVVTATPETASVGGRLVVALGSFDTLDPQVTSDGNAMTVHQLLGSTLLAKDVDGSYVPYLATGWEVSEDGMVWTFNLRDDVKFHDGTPLTANDFVWTIQRLLDPATGAGQSGRLRSVGEVVALDDYTLQITLASPYPVLLEQLSNTGVSQPLLQSFVESSEDPFGQGFVGVGPYMLKEYFPGERVVITRNPDFAWGPAIGENTGAYYIEDIEFRILPEAATVIAGLEAGEIDYAAIGSEDLELIQDIGSFQIIEALFQGLFPSVHMNLSLPVFEDLRVRQALNLAVDRDLLVQIVANGFAEPQYGPLSPSMPDYWEGVEYIGYHYDLEEAKTLLEDAGYAYNADGMLEKDGQPFKLALKTDQAFTKLAEVLQEQFKAVGVEVEIVIEEPGILWGSIFGGDYEIYVGGYGASESDILYRWFHATREGALNISHHNDPELDRLLDLTRSTGDVEQRRQYVYDVQKYMVEQAIVVPLYATQDLHAVSTRVQGVVASPLELLTMKVKLNDAYIRE